MPAVVRYVFVTFLFSCNPIASARDIACVSGLRCGEDVHYAFNWMRKERDLTSKLLIGYNQTRKAIRHGFCKPFVVGSLEYSHAGACLKYNQAVCLYDVQALRLVNASIEFANEVVTTMDCLCSSKCSVPNFFARDGKDFDIMPYYVSGGCGYDRDPIRRGKFGRLLQCLSAVEECKPLFNRFYGEAGISCKFLMKSACRDTVSVGLSGGDCEYNGSIVEEEPDEEKVEESTETLSELEAGVEETDDNGDDQDGDASLMPTGQVGVHAGVSSALAADDSAD